jgi:AbiU2
LEPQLLTRTKDAFNAFRVESIWTRTVYDTFTALYAQGAENEALLKRTAPLFFSDLRSILIEYWVLVVCKLTDPSETNGRENLTAKNIVACLAQLGLLTESIQREADGLQGYRDLLNNARNRVVSHADKDTFLSPELLGEHEQDKLHSFLAHLQRFNDLVGETLSEGPLDFTGTSAPGDVYDLLSVLKSTA